MKFINVNTKLPECHSQHGNVFSTGNNILTVDIHGEYHINEYHRYGEFNSNGWTQTSEGWAVSDGEIVGWCEIIEDKNISVINDIIKWLEQRISTTDMEKNTATDLNLVVGKGGKLCAYKEVLEYIKTHS